MMITRRIIKWGAACGDWCNRPLISSRHDIRVIDGMMVLMGAGIFSYYFYVHNWQQAVIATLTYIMVWMVAQWLL